MSGRVGAREGMKEHIRVRGRKRGAESSQRGKLTNLLKGGLEVLSDPVRQLFTADEVALMHHA
eukprot:6208763-Pleurochrysis_carterae.AAC.1